MSDKRDVNDCNNGVDFILQQSGEIEGILKLQRKDLRLYLQDVLNKQRNFESRVAKLKKNRKEVVEENDRLKKQNDELQRKIERKRLKQAVVSITNRSLRLQLKKFYEVAAFATIGLIVADGIIDIVSADFKSLNACSKVGFVFEIGLRVFGAAAIGFTMFYAKPSDKNSGKRVKTNSCEEAVQQLENVS